MPIAVAGRNTVQIRANESGFRARKQPTSLRTSTFANVYETHITRVYGFVFSHVGNREDAEDVTSQVFVKAFKAMAGFEARGSLEGWLFQIARTAVADFWRDRYKLPAVPLVNDWDMASPDGTEEFDQSAREQRVKELLARLPANYREVLVQRFFERNSIAETARAMGISEANARVLQFRALRRAAELEGDGCA